MSSTDSRFSTVKRGYAPDEVDEFLQTHLAPLQEELDAARAHVVSLEAEVGDGQAREEAMRVTLLAATKTRDEFVADAEKRHVGTSESLRDEAHEILGDARREAVTLLQQANAEADHAIAASRREVDRIVAAANVEAEDVVGRATDRNAITQSAIDEIREEALTSRAEAKMAREEAKAAIADAKVIKQESDAAVAEAAAAIARADTAGAEADDARASAETTVAEAEALKMEAEIAKAAGTAARSGAIAGAAELRENALADGEVTRREAKAEAAAIVERAGTDATALLAAATANAEITRSEASAEADRLVHEARREALSIIDEIRTETEALLAQAMALTSPAPPSAPASTGNGHAAETAAVGPSASIPDVAGQSGLDLALDRDSGSDDHEYEGRRTIYARRSAGLPHIGAAGVSEALAAVSAMRIRLDGTSGGNIAQGEPVAGADVPPARPEPTFPPGNRTTSAVEGVGPRRVVGHIDDLGNFRDVLQDRFLDALAQGHGGQTAPLAAAPEFEMGGAALQPYQ